jgi:very-short-patch-repair endonuclease
MGLVVEIDGGHHRAALLPLDDALRQNEVTLTNKRVLRIPLTGWRLDRDVFMDQVARGLALPEAA